MRALEPANTQPRSGPPDADCLCLEVTQLRTALETREAIGQAKGIIRLLTRCDSQTAFDVLCKLSQDANLKVRDVAVVIAECAAAGNPLPPELRESWQQRTRSSVLPHP